MHEQGTLGRRIQEGRRAAGLSQEALGERLNVSRQAVSKWESDAAIPELENLIAMSRIFGVSIGRLLGVEPERTEEPARAEAAGEPERAPADGGLTEKELAAVEAIAAKYAAEAQRHQRPKWSKRRKVLTCALAAVLVLAAGILAKRQLDAIDRWFVQVQQQMVSIQNSVTREVGSLTWQMSNILDEKNHILANYQVVVTDFDVKAQTVTLQVSASPKEWTDTTTAVFTAAPSGGGQFSADGAGRNGVFTAEGLVVPMDRAIQLSVTLMDGGSARTGSLETLYDCLPGNFQLHVSGGMGISWRDSSGQVTLSDLSLTIDSYITSDHPTPLYPVAVDLCLYRNRETEPEQVIPVKEAVPLFRKAGSVDMRYFSDYQTSFALAEDDTMATPSVSRTTTARPPGR